MMLCMVCGRQHPMDSEFRGDTIWTWHLRHRTTHDVEAEEEFKSWCDYVEGMTS